MLIQFHMDALLLFLLLTRLLSSKTFCDRKLLPSPPTPPDLPQLELQVEFSPHVIILLPYRLLLLLLTLFLLLLLPLLLSLLLLLLLLALLLLLMLLLLLLLLLLLDSFWIHIRVRIAHIESCFYCRCCCRFHYINRLPRPRPCPEARYLPTPYLPSSISTSSCSDCCRCLCL